MTAPPRTEAKIDVSNAHLQQRALEIALSRALSGLRKNGLP